MITADLFEDEERQYLNKYAEGVGQERLSRKEILDCIAFAREIMEMDREITSLLDGVYSKIYNLTDSEWDFIKKQIPFPVSISTADLDEELDRTIPEFIVPGDGKFSYMNPLEWDGEE